MLPILAITDPDDARAVYDALNAAYVACTDETRRNRLALLLIATHAEMTRLTADTHCASCDYGQCDTHGTGY